MDASAGLIILVFVIVIFSSLGGNRGYHQPTANIYDEGFVSIEAIAPVVPHVTSFEVEKNNDHLAIKHYILKYRSEEEAEQISDSIIKYAIEYGVNPKLTTALMARESRFNPNAVSSSGAIGLGQLLPSTCKGLKVENPYDIDENTMGTTKYLKYLLDRFAKYNDQIAMAISGYFEGPNAVERNKGVKTHTAQYVNDILGIYNKI
ncbi:MAG: lytic transglycosylase domain-containing protein [Candidatus Margulisbacteria bacterium]|nr:lytic transglycosylase domain-containing protein [Candidatus Margulisiibacteriota bacterium]